MQQFAAAEIGARIAQARKEAGGMTQPDLAEALNVSTRSVQDYEAGVTIPWKHFERLEQIFSRSLQWFLYGKESPEGMPSVQAEDRLELLGVIQAMADDVAEVRAAVRRLEEQQPPGAAGREAEGPT